MFGASIRENGVSFALGEDFFVSAGDFKLNGKEQGTPYEINEGKDKKISISDSYGDVSLKVE
jgi:hypothetical protein